MATFAFDEIPESVKRLDAAELGRRAKLSMNPPEPLPPDVVERLRAAVPAIAQVDAALDAPGAFDATNPNFYSWAYIKLRPWRPNAFFITFCAVAAFAIGRVLLTALLARYPLPVLITAAIVLDGWGSFVLACAAPVALLAAIRGSGRSSDAMRRSLAMFLASASLALLAGALASAGAVRAALLSSAVLRCVPLPMAIWLWKDLRADIADDKTAIARVFKMWRALATLFVCAFGTCLRAVVLASSPANDFFYFMCEKTLGIRLALGSMFPVSLSLLRDKGGVQCFVAVIYAMCFLYGLYVICVATNFFGMRDHRKTRTPMSMLFIRTGLYDDGFRPRSRRFVSSAPPGVKSYRPSSVMLLQKVEGLLGRESALLVNEERPIILDLLDSEREHVKNKNAPQWMPPRTEYLVPNDKLSREQISMNSLHTWARPLTEEEKQKPFAEFFETLQDDQFEYDAHSDQWKFTEAMNDPAVPKEEFSLNDDTDFEKFKEFVNNLNSGDSDSEENMRTVFV